MLSYLLDSFKTSIDYLKNHSHIVFVLILIFILPILFFYNGQRFLDAGRSNQDRIQKEKVGLLQDVYVSLLKATDFSVPVMQDELVEIARLNYDILDFRVVKLEGGLGEVLASLDSAEVKESVIGLDRYRNATVYTDSSTSYEDVGPKGRIWSAYRAVEVESGVFYVVETSFDLSGVDKLFAQREREAMMTLIYIFIFVGLLVYWQIKSIDYKYLYTKTKIQNESKDNFINMMSHELRAPLTAIKGYAELVSDSTQDEKVTEYSRRISVSSNRLLEIINDLLDVARVQSGKITVKIDSADIAGVIRSVAMELQVVAAEKNIEIVTVGTDTPHIAMADTLRLHQAVTNIVSNSIKYTSDGQIEIEVVEKARTVEIRVKDKGIGIDSEDQKQLFAPFFRVKRAEVTQITGTGLGMWITKQIITLMNGTVGVESIRNVGTHIVINLPKQLKK